jgi:TusA-related sulfurtransferase
MAPGETLVVLATDPEAPMDLAALAADEGHGFEREWDAADERHPFDPENRGSAWRITLTKGATPR